MPKPASNGLKHLEADKEVIRKENIRSRTENSYFRCRNILIYFIQNFHLASFILLLNDKRAILRLSIFLYLHPAKVELHRLHSNKCVSATP